jgi:hypothetical protein
MDRLFARFRLWNALLFSRWRWAVIAILWALTAAQVIRAELPTEIQKQWYAAGFLPHWLISMGDFSFVWIPSDYIRKRLS